MAWIESHQDLEMNGKLIKTMVELNWEKDKVIGFLHRFWWFVLEQAEDGNLSKFDKDTLRIALGVPIEVINSLYSNGWIDKDNKVHDWLDYCGHYLKSKYHTSDPKKYDKIKKLYTTKQGTPKGIPKGTPKVILKDSPPYLTLPNLKEHIDTPIQTIINEFKRLKGYDKDNGWDKANYSRHTRPSKTLYEYLDNNLPACLDCLRQVGGELNSSNNSDISKKWGLEAIIKAAAGFKLEMDKNKQKEQEVKKSKEALNLAIKAQKESQNVKL